MMLVKLIICTGIRHSILHMYHLIDAIEWQGFLSFWHTFSRVLLSIESGSLCGCIPCRTLHVPMPRLDIHLLLVMYWFAAEPQILTLDQYFGGEKKEFHVEYRSVMNHFEVVLMRNILTNEFKSAHANAEQTISSILCLSFVISFNVGQWINITNYPTSIALFFSSLNWTANSDSD